MITIKNNCYDTCEKLALASILGKMKEEVIPKLCEKHDSTCESCPYRHVCYDISKAFDYAKTDALNTVEYGHGGEPV